MVTRTVTGIGMATIVWQMAQALAVAFPVMIIPINPHVMVTRTVTGIGMATIVWQVAQALAVAFPVMIIPINPHVMVTRTVTGIGMLPHLPVKKKMASMLLSSSHSR